MRAIQERRSWRVNDHALLTLCWVWLPLVCIKQSCFDLTMTVSRLIGLTSWPRLPVRFSPGICSSGVSYLQLILQPRVDCLPFFVAHWEIRASGRAEDLQSREPGITLEVLSEQGLVEE